MPTPVYLISLAGQGDREYTLVGEATFKWLTDKDAPMPVEQISAQRREQAADKSRKDEDEDGFQTYLAYVQRWEGSSPDNDRALKAQDEYRQSGETFWTMKDVRAFCKQHDLEIVDDYEGVIY